MRVRRWLAITFACAIWICTISGCRSGAQSDSQTHWLNECNGPEDCGRLECLCGYCLERCNEESSCGASGAAPHCFARSSSAALILCQEEGARNGICLEGCAADSDCDEGQSCLGGGCLPSSSKPGLQLVFGEPVGPIQRSFAVAEGARIAAPDGDGEICSLEAPCSLVQAVTQATSGDVVALLAGVYRVGEIAFDKEILIQPYGAQRAVLDGAVVMADWTRAGDLWVSSLPSVPVTTEAGAPHFGLWWDGKSLPTAASAADVTPGTFHVDGVSGVVTVGDDPSGAELQVTRWAYALERVYWSLGGTTGPDEAGTRVQGLIFQHYATAALWSRAEGLAVEHCQFVDNAGSGLLTFRGGNAVRFNQFRGNSGAPANLGNFGASTFSNNWVLENLIEANAASKESAVVGVGVGANALVHHNLLQDNAGKGLSIGFDSVGARVTANVIERGGGMDGSGIILEGTADAIVAGNIVRDCSSGIHLTNCVGSRVYNNTFAGTKNPVTIREYVREPYYGGSLNSADTVLKNNIFWGASATDWPNAAVSVTTALCGSHTMITGFDYNAYFSSDAAGGAVRWDPMPSSGKENAACQKELAPVFTQLRDFQESTGWETHGVVGTVTDAVFSDAENFVPAASSVLAGAEPLPDDVRDALQWPLDAPAYRGAVQIRP